MKKITLAEFNALKFEIIEINILNDVEKDDRYAAARLAAGDLTIEFFRGMRTINDDTVTNFSISDSDPFLFKIILTKLFNDLNIEHRMQIRHRER